MVGKIETEEDIAIDNGLEDEFAEEETIYMRCLSEEYGNDLVSMNVYSDGSWWEPQYFNF